MREFSRLADRLMARLGDEAVLRGETVSPARRAHVEHNVDVIQNEVAAQRSVVSMPRSYAGRRGDTLTLTDPDDGTVTNYVLDSPPISDDGYLQRFVVRLA